MTVEDVRQLMGASTPHFALQLRNRIANLIAGLPAEHPARVEGEREIARLERLGFSGETRGEAARSTASARCPRCPRSTRRREPEPGAQPGSAAAATNAARGGRRGSARAAV